MHAQHSVQAPLSQQAQVARLLLQANLAYGESNSYRLSYVQRLKARRECRGYLDDAQALDANNAQVLGLLGRVAMDDGELERARELFLASLEQDPAQAQQHTNLGYWALKTERPAQAEGHFLQALEHDRQSAAAFCGIAHTKRLNGQPDVAYLHYRKLLQMGIEWDSVYSGMLECARHLEISQADTELALDAIALLRRDGLAHQELGRFVAAILHQQYDLDDANARVFLDAACEDELLILTLKKTLMPDPAIEELISLLRRAIIAEVAHTAELRDELQDLALAIALYADRTGYALPADDDEEQLIATINSSIEAQLAMGEQQDALVGSLILSAMYCALFHQRFAVSLGQWSLVDWPLGLQPVMAGSYYNRAGEEAIKQNFAEKAEELCLDRQDLPQASPAWSRLSQQAESNLKTIMSQDLSMDTGNLPDTLRLMVCGARSGQRALELARYLDDVEVVAVDESLANIAKATRLADDLGISNIVFWPWSVARQFVADGHQVHWIDVGRLPSTTMTDFSLPAMIRQASAKGAVVHLHTGLTEQTRGDEQIRRLIDEHRLRPTRNSLRQLRRMVLTNRFDNLWQDLLDEPDFYSLGGCRDRWFRPQNGRQLQQLMSLLSNEVEWKLLKARDTDGHSLATTPVQQQIQAEALGSEVQSLMGQNLSVYFQRRR